MDKSVTEAIGDLVMETAGLSAPGPAMRNANYLFLLSLGDDAIPMILKRIADQDGGLPTLLMLLHDITGVTAHDPEYNGYMNEIRKAWIMWGEMDFDWPDEESER